jgi:inositol 1,4,5-triphosphate receptor type 1/inositol 1,4,5-triphosphate receptor type 3
MNILIFFGYNTEKDVDGIDVLYHVEFFGINPYTCELILNILGILIAVFSFVKLFEFLTREAVLIFKTLYTDYLKEGYEERINQMNNLEIHRVKDFFHSKNYKKISIYIRLIFNLKVIYALLYMAIAILGIAEHKFFFAFHLVEFILSQPILLYVFRAIIDPIAQLAYTFIFFFILIYFYSLIIFYFFQDIMPENSCDSPIICMVFIYSNTFTSGGNLGNFIDEGNHGLHENLNGDMKRYALDISYTIIMVGLTWQMVSGLIVDTFESLRGSREDKEDDMKTICFICGLDKEKIEKYYPGKEGFEKHLKDHSVANYFFYTFYLEDKESSEYSGLESYIKDQIDNESISWFPNGRSLKIEEWESKHKITHDT